MCRPLMFFCKQMIFLDLHLPFVTHKKNRGSRGFCDYLQICLCKLFGACRRRLIFFIDDDALYGVAEGFGFFYSLSFGVNADDRFRV